MDHGGQVENLQVEADLRGLIRESRNQSPSNLECLRRLSEIWTRSSYPVNVKLENFTKYVTRETLTKFIARYEVFKRQLDVHGSVVEVGVARGASLFTWYHLSSILEPTNYTREIVGFDTFSGFPHISEKDSSTSLPSEHMKIGGFKVESDIPDEIYECAEVHDKTRFLGHIKKIYLCVGDAREEIPKFVNENPHLLVSLLHLDADLYEPTKVALEYFVPRMPRGAIILFDELNLRQFPGETIATLERLGISNLRVQRFSFATSMSFVIL